MTIKELKKRIDIRHDNGYGQYTITIQYRNKEYSCHSTNSIAYDNYKDADHPLNQNQALREAWSECKRKNNLY